ncbi:MAG: transporter ATP-binding protein [Actinomycetia bacterium]|nr:transporter ATP-binding protein [Actinomycetes bacterium]
MTASTRVEDARCERPDLGPVLAVDGLQTHFVTKRGTVEAVRGVGFALDPGERLAIVGESGSGKSALALSILGLIEPPGKVVAGTVRLAGQNIEHLPDRAMQRIRGRRIALIYQDAMQALDPVKTIGSQLGEALRLHGGALSRKAARRRAIELLREVEVPKAAQRVDSYPHEYSGGMRQRVVIAMALANEPDVLIADEPTTALDVTTQAQVLGLLDRLVAERRTAVILITHNLALVAEFCDTIAVMYAGRLVEQTSTERLFAAPQHPYAQALLAAMLRSDRLETGPLPSIPGSPPDLVALPTGCAFRARCHVGRSLADCAAIDPPLAAVREEGRVACHHPSEART